VGGQPVATTTANRPDPSFQAGHDGFQAGFRFDLTKLGLACHEMVAVPGISVRAAGTDAVIEGAAGQLHEIFALSPERYGLFAFAPQTLDTNLFFNPIDIRRWRNARGRLPHVEILSRMRQHVKRSINAGVDWLAAKSFRYRGFLWRNAFQDGMLLFIVEEKVEYLRWINVLIERLAAFDDLEEYANDEVNAGMIMVGLVTALESAAAAGVTLRSRDLAIDTIERIGTFLARQAVERHWGERSRDRFAWNHSVIGFAAMGLASLSARVKHPHHAEWLAEATWRCQAHLRYGVDDSGMSREGLAYCGFTFAVVGVFLKALFRSYPISHYFHQAPGCQSGKYDRIVEWCAYDKIPGMPHISGWNDAERTAHQTVRGLLNLPPAELNPAVTRLWFSFFGAEGDARYGDAPNYWHSCLFDSYVGLPTDNSRYDASARLALSRFYPTDGYLYARTDWSTEATSFIFKCGAHTHGLHGQADNNSFTLTARGRPFIVDSGPANDTTPGSASQWEAHNVVSIDGGGQKIAGRGAGVTGHVIDREEGMDYSYILGDAAASYGAGGVAVARRHMLLMKVPFALLLCLDEIVVDTPFATIERRFHIDPRFTAARRMTPNTFVLATQDGSDDEAMFWFEHPPADHLQATFTYRDASNNLEIFRNASEHAGLIAIVPDRRQSATLRIAVDEPGVYRVEHDNDVVRVAFPLGASAGYDGRRAARGRPPIAAGQ
jgi:hypothetical protein